MTCEPGDLLPIPFPYADLSAAKKRPVQALTSPDRHGDFVALAVTSVEQTERAIQLGADDFAQGTLPKPSWVLLDKVFTLSERSLVRRLGKVSSTVMQGALAGLCATVGYTRRQ